MNKIHVLSSVACVTVILAMGALAGGLGSQSGISNHPKDKLVIQLASEQSAEQTHERRVVLIAEDRNVKNANTDKKDMKRKHPRTAGASATETDGPK